jgi:hypothetical protein
MGNLTAIIREGSQRQLRLGLLTLTPEFVLWGIFHWTRTHFQCILFVLK